MCGAHFEPPSHPESARADGERDLLIIQVDRLCRSYVVALVEESCLASGNVTFAVEGFFICIFKVIGPCAALGQLAERVNDWCSRRVLEN